MIDIKEKTMLSKGLAYEKVAQNYLLKAGLRTLNTNFHCKSGEIDLIMKDKETLVFIEVRYRKNSNYGSASESVHIHKQRKIIRSAEYYLNIKKLWHLAVRFDVIAISPSIKLLGKNNITWHKSAFIC